MGVSSGMRMSVARTGCRKWLAPVVVSKTLGRTAWCWSNDALAHCTRMSKAGQKSSNRIEGLSRNEAVDLQ